MAASLTVATTANNHDSFRICELAPTKSALLSGLQEARKFFSVPFLVSIPVYLNGGFATSPFRGNDSGRETRAYVGRITFF